MTNIYLEPTSISKDTLFENFTGIYIISAETGEIDEENNFKIYPIICRQIINGVPKNYLKISQIKMELNNLFNSIELIGNDLDFSSTLFGGCGKNDQYPLLVSQGGPHILINNFECK